uniref:VOC family protein n=1 Tax=Tessaracoccus timonensis TaxID=2161816 RepID=UPI000D554F71|nr:VOC family protein [Tessaracoccus timonensis]
MARPQGTTAWLDYGATDAAAAKEFYAGLFGWEIDDLGEEVAHYNMIRKGDSLVGGFMDIAGMTCPDGSPLEAYWGVFLAVDNAENSAKTVESNGGTLVFPVGSAGAAGSFAVMSDPAQHPLSLWQAGEVEGFDFTGQPGTPVWFELMTEDVDKELEFYTKSFGANFVPMKTTMQDDCAAERYYTNGAQDEASWGLGDASSLVAGEKPGWRVYFGVESSADAIAAVEKLGGTIIDGPDSSPFGAIITVADPSGATFQLCAMSEARPE